MNTEVVSIMLSDGQSSQKIHAFCALGTAHCASIATIVDGKVVRLEGDPYHPNGGVFCVK